MRIAPLACLPYIASVVAFTVAALVGCGAAAPPATTPPATTAAAADPPAAVPASAPAPPSVATPAPSSASAGAAATSASKGQTVPLANGGTGYLVAAAGGPVKHPAVLVIQEWWGMNDWIKGDTERFASQGYIALAVDLYRGRVAGTPDEAHELMRGLPEDRAMSDMRAAFELLAARPDVDPKRIGIVGWCMGGGYALDFATAEPRLRAAVVNYGHLQTDGAKIAAIKPSLLGNFGGKDRGIPAADVKAFESSLKAKGKEIDFKVYDAAGHAFMNPNNKTGYDDDAAKDAWHRIDAFFERTLKGP
jgi:carboxymethylenebutenolidase